MQLVAVEGDEDGEKRAWAWASSVGLVARQCRVSAQGMQFDDVIACVESCRAWAAGWLRQLDQPGRRLAGWGTAGDLGTVEQQAASAVAVLCAQDRGAKEERAAARRTLRAIDGRSLPAAHYLRPPPLRRPPLRMQHLQHLPHTSSDATAATTTTRAAAITRSGGGGATTATAATADLTEPTTNTHATTHNDNTSHTTA